MSATGQGTTLIAGVNFALIKSQTLPPSGTLVFTHSGATQPNGPGRPAYSVVVTQGDPTPPGTDLGNDLLMPFTNAAPLVTLSQSNDAITITNTDAGAPVTIYVECKWLENSEELNLVAVDDPSIVITTP